MNWFNTFFLHWFLGGEFLGSLIPVFQSPLWILADRIVLGFLRFMCVIGILFAVFHLFIHRVSPGKKINPEMPTASDYFRELKFALINGFIVNTIIIAGVGWMASSGRVIVYTEPAQYGLIYFYLSFPLLVIGLDVYFYVIHRALHSPWAYRKIHYIHHLSRVTNPLSGFSFHPIEGFLLFAFPSLWMLLFPVHIQAANFISWWAAIVVPLGHCGFEFYPRTLRRKPWAFFFNCPIHHEVHHRFGDRNFSLFFNFWDSLFGTNHPEYHTELKKFEDRPRP